MGTSGKKKSLLGFESLQEKLALLEKESARLRKELLLRKKAREASGPLADLKSGMKQLKKMIIASETEMMETKELLDRLENNYKQTENVLDQIEMRMSILEEEFRKKEDTFTPEEQYLLKKTMSEELQSMLGQIKSIRKKREELEKKINGKK